MLGVRWLPPLLLLLPLLESAAAGCSSFAAGAGDEAVSDSDDAEEESSLPLGAALFVLGSDEAVASVSISYNGDPTSTVSSLLLCIIVGLILCHAIMIIIEDIVGWFGKKAVF